MNPTLVIKAGREKSILRRHPWVFSGAVADVSGGFAPGEPAPGATVDVVNSKGEFLARGSYSPQSQIQARIWTWDENEPVDEAFFHKRLAEAIERRANAPALVGSSALRLVHAESDLLPGLIVDRYGDWAVVQTLSWGAEFWREVITRSLMDLLPVSGVYERSDVEVRRLEGLEERIGLVQGEAPPELIEIHEGKRRYWVDVRRGHKTGFYLDQRANHQHVCALSHAADVLDCFCYSGGFSVAALAGGAKFVTSVDVSTDALSLAHRNVALNNLDVSKIDFVDGDVFQMLRKYRDMDRSFDLIVLDPPKFASTARLVERAARGYKDINLLALKLLRPGGILATFSCSGGIDPELFQRIVAGAALDAGVDAQIQTRLFQDADHPVLLSFPEGAYLKGLLVVVT